AEDRSADPRRVDAEALRFGELPVFADGRLTYELDVLQLDTAQPVGVELANAQRQRVLVLLTRVELRLQLGLSAAKRQREVEEHQQADQVEASETKPAQNFFAARSHPSSPASGAFGDFFSGSFRSKAETVIETSY